jgi:hypothetical protein
MGKNNCTSRSTISKRNSAVLKNQRKGKVDPVSKMNEKQLRSFARKILAAGINVSDIQAKSKRHPGYFDRSSDFYYCKNFSQRAERLSFIPLPVFLLPIQKNTEYFLAAFETTDEDRVKKHRKAYESCRKRLLDIFSIRNSYLDSCSMFNNLMQHCGDKFLACMNERRKYPQAKFQVVLPYNFALDVVVPGLKVAGWSEIEAKRKDGRVILRALSRFVLENTIACSNHNLKGKPVSRKAVYLHPDQQTGEGFSPAVREAAMVDKSPFEMKRGELLTVFERNEWFGEDSERWGSSPTYELATKVFDELSVAKDLYGVDSYFSVTPIENSWCDLIFLPDRSSFGLAKLYVVFFLSKFRVEFSAQQNKHVICSDDFAR